MAVAAGVTVDAARNEVTLFFGGDTSHGESYQEQYKAEGDVSILDRRRYNAAFRDLTGLMEDSDLVVLNLETTLTHRRESPIKGKPSYLYSDPDRAPGALRRIGVDAVSLANNHLLDFGPEGLEETLAALQRVGVEGFGAGMDLAAAERPFVRTFETDAGPIRVAIISCFERRDWYEPFGFYADADKPGVNAIDLPRLRKQISQIRSANPQTFVVVTPHWGENYVWRTQRLQQDAESMVAAGADLVIGHGAHRLQEIERIDGRWVFYSIGNFVFNSRGRFQSWRSPSYSLPLRVTLARSVAGIRVGIRGYPIVGDNLVTDYQPQPVAFDQLPKVRELLLAYDSSGVLSREGVWGRDALGPCVALAAATSGMVERLPDPDPSAVPFPRGAGDWYFNSDGEPPLRVWTYWPKEHQPDDDVLIVMPGTRRNGDVYRDAWAEHAERLGTLLLVPEFSKTDYPTGRGYQHLNYRDAKGDPTPVAARAPSRIERLFDDVVERLTLRADRFYLYGHSAGGQFVHRMMLTAPDPSVHFAIAANSGWYTLPDGRIAYPEGTADTPDGSAELTAAITRPVVVLLGEADTNPEHSSLPRGDAAQRQGPHRFARGLYFFDLLTSVAANHGVKPEWRLETVPGISHSNLGMTPRAAELIAEHIKSRKRDSTQ